MKTIQLLPLLLLFLVASCSAVRVNSDYDKKVDFSQFKTYAFYKTGIDKVEISDLDKKRILRSIDEEMAAKGFAKSETPDLLININTKAEKDVNVNQFYAGYGYGWGYGWSPYWGGSTSVYTSTEGILTIDLIDAKKKELVWQGVGSGNLTQDTNKKDENIKCFVNKILELYPPAKK
ncbi:DUF4136 domain-containing protein [Flavobacterium psychrotolerans]|uniref:DUF4136 domain-containing protein n=1 Tax=Flavobacterium psychrotolerans TaxID=2169410 RepID=A0A2U1JHN7_9FLAO|nr:DUF4136 domain-containing protein [Flavobacterium psychrotolerans]PWA04438.1 DUF4136 domain-containing protein [Flavobacterium psychrotolerans]